MDEVGKAEGLHGLADEVGFGGLKHDHEELVCEDLGRGKRWA